MCAGGREGWVLTEPWEVGRLNEISKDEEVVFRRKVRKAFLSPRPAYATIWRHHSQKVLIEHSLCARSYLRKHKEQGIDEELERVVDKAGKRLGNSPVHVTVD